MPAVWETWVLYLGQEDPLEEGMATHCSILAWRIPMNSRAWLVTVHGVTKSRTGLKRSSSSSSDFLTTGKTIALTRRTFVGKVMSLLFNMLSRLVITFLPRSKRLLISWLQSPSAVILEPNTVSTVLPSIQIHMGRFRTPVLEGRSGYVTGMSKK